MACPGLGYQAAGMQSLVTAIRSAGARNVILLAGLAWANDLTGWLRHAPRDPDRNLASSWHFYPWNACNTGPSLITNYDGSPTGYGAGYRAHLRSLK